MFCLLPFIGWQVLHPLWCKGPESTWSDFRQCFRSPKLRVWLVLISASALTRFTGSLFDYMAIDAICAALIMARPRGSQQRFIGALFVMMLVCDLGFYLSGAANPAPLFGILSALGWLQFAILAVWTGHDIRKHYRAPVGNASGVSLNPLGRS